MISITNITTKKNWNKPVHTYEVKINTAIKFKFRHTRSESLSVIFNKASKAAKRHEDEELLGLLEAFSQHKSEVGSLSSFPKGSSGSYKNNHLNFKKAHK